MEQIVKKILEKLLEGKEDIKECKDQLDLLFSDLYLKNVGREGEKKVKKISV